MADLKEVVKFAETNFGNKNYQHTYENLKKASLKQILLQAFWDTYGQSSKLNKNASGLTLSGLSGGDLALKMIMDWYPVDDKKSVEAEAKRARYSTAWSMGKEFIGLRKAEAFFYNKIVLIDDINLVALREDNTLYIEKSSLNSDNSTLVRVYLQKNGVLRNPDVEKSELFTKEELIELQKESKLSFTDDFDNTLNRILKIDYVNHPIRVIARGLFNFVKLPELVVNVVDDLVEALLAKTLREVAKLDPKNNALDVLPLIYLIPATIVLLPAHLAIKIVAVAMRLVFSSTNAWKEADSIDPKLGIAARVATLALTVGLCFAIPPLIPYMGYVHAPMILANIGVAAKAIAGLTKIPAAYALASGLAVMTGIPQIGKMLTHWRSTQFNRLLSIQPNFAKRWSEPVLWTPIHSALFITIPRILNELSQAVLPAPHFAERWTRPIFSKQVHEYFFLPVEVHDQNHEADVLISRHGKSEEDSDNNNSQNHSSDTGSFNYIPEESSNSFGEIDYFDQSGGYDPNSSRNSFDFGVSEASSNSSRGIDNCDQSDGPDDDSRQHNDCIAVRSLNKAESAAKIDRADSDSSLDSNNGVFPQEQSQDTVIGTTEIPGNGSDLLYPSVSDPINQGHNLQTSTQHSFDDICSVNDTDNEI